MPLFEYVCAEGHREEYLEPYEFPNLRMCGECHGWLNALYLPQVARLSRMAVRGRNSTNAATPKTFQESPQGQEESAGRKGHVRTVAWTRYCTKPKGHDGVPTTEAKRSDHAQEHRAV